MPDVDTAVEKASITEMELFFPSMVKVEIRGQVLVQGSVVVELAPENSGSYPAFRLEPSQDLLGFMRWCPVENVGESDAVKVRELDQVQGALYPIKCGLSGACF